MDNNIKYIFSTIFVFAFIINSSIAQSKKHLVNNFIEKNIITDFGAKGDGKNDDHAAFEAAATYFNNHGGNGKLIIPFGIYKVGKQMIDTPKSFTRRCDVFSIKDVSHFSIEGIVNTSGQYPVLKCCDGLYYGSFNYHKNNFGIPMCSPVRNNYDYKSLAAIGATIFLDNCSDILINNIELDGNLENVIIGGYWGDMGRQGLHAGILMQRGRAINLNNIYTHHFCLDGLENMGAENLHLKNVVSEYNGRQGFSWVNGDSLVAENCKFNHTGRLLLHSPPSAGIDIEPEGDKDISSAQFTNCEFNYNVGCGLLMSENKNTIKNMHFFNCTFLGMYSWAAWIPGVNIHFNNCNFYGNIVHTIPNRMVHLKSNITSFTHCYFNDIYKGVTTAKSGYYFFPLDNESILIDSSIIKVSNRGFLWHSNGCNSMIDSLKSEIKNTTIYSSSQNDWLASISGIKLTNTKLYYLSGSFNFPCTNDFYHFDKIISTPQQMAIDFPESIGAINNSFDTVKYFVCTNDLVLHKQTNKVSRKAPIPSLSLSLSDTSFILLNNTAKDIIATANIYNSKNKIIFTVKKIVTKANYTNAIPVKLPLGNYILKILQNKAVIAQKKWRINTQP